MGEVDAVANQSVEVRGMNLGIVDGVNRAEHEVVRNEEEKVRPTVSRGRCGGHRSSCLCGGKGGGGETNKFTSIHRHSQKGKAFVIYGKAVKEHGGMKQCNPEGQHTRLARVSRRFTVSHV